MQQRLTSGEFKGLFVGIDRYASSRINWLSCAKRDAIALHALFTDNLGGTAVLLTDEEATRTHIEAALQNLTTCSENDVVVLAFSGHGTKTHQLVTYDTNPADLENTTISLEALTNWFARTPAKRLVCVLDCCFSGGMGAKVLEVDIVPRDIMMSPAELLDRLAGEGRLILTASRATEPAYENQNFGHGLLTHALLEALQGAEEVQQGGKLSIYRLLDYVTNRVQTAAAQFGKPQHPTLRGRIDKELIWPVFVPGTKYHQALPEVSLPKVTPDVYSLEPYGFPRQLLSLIAESIPNLNGLQLDAINALSPSRESSCRVRPYLLRKNSYRRVGCTQRCASAPPCGVSLSSKGNC